MTYTISESCYGCGTCKPQCPTGAIQLQNGQYWIESELCNNCEGHYNEPQCIVSCPVASPLPLQSKKGRYKTTRRTATSPELFVNSKNHSFASSMVIWEACNLLTSALILPWQIDETGKPYLEKSVKQGRGAIALSLTGDLNLSHPSSLLKSQAIESATESIDIRSASLHLIYAAYATTLERPWEQEFILNDQQIEKYLGLDKRKDLSKATKLTLIKTLAQQPCKIVTSVDWPQQGKVKGFKIEEDRLWHLLDIEHHFQEDELGCKHLIGLTFRLRAGLWAKYFLNQQAYKQRIAFYQYGTLPHFLLQAVMSIWQQHEGAARLMLWLLFKIKMGKEQRMTVPTLMQVAYGAERVSQATGNRDDRKRLLRTFESDLETLDRYGFKPLFDPITYRPEIQPLWAKLAELPDDAEAALEFWIQDGASARRLTDSGPRGKWDLLMRARILGFKLPPEWDRQLVKLEKQKQRRMSRKVKSKERSGLSAAQILAARKRRGMSQRVLAQMTGKSQSWIRDLEKGRLSAKPEDQLLLKKALGLG